MNCPNCPKYKPELPKFGEQIINGVKVPVLLNKPDNIPCGKHALEVWTQRFSEPSIKFFKG